MKVGQVVVTRGRTIDLINCTGKKSGKSMLEILHDMIPF
jgi:hypothetical protein